MLTDEEISQYEQTLNDWRMYDNVIWQLPSLSLAISSGIIVLAYGTLQDIIPRMFILLIGFLMQSGLTIALWKHRVYQDCRIEIINDIESKWAQDGEIKRVVARKREQLDQSTIASKISAADILKIIMGSISLMLCILFIQTLLSLYTPII